MDWQHTALLVFLVNYACQLQPFLINVEVAHIVVRPGMLVDKPE